jgi:hypothetical protein
MFFVAARKKIISPKMKFFLAASDRKVPEKITKKQPGRRGGGELSVMSY